MKTLYTILFFSDILLLTGLSWLFLQKFDNGSRTWVLILIFSGMVASIFLLIFLLKNYITQPPGQVEPPGRKRE